MSFRTLTPTETSRSSSASAVSTGKPTRRVWFLRFVAVVAVVGFAVCGNGSVAVAAPGDITEFTLPFGSEPEQIVSGPDGNLWFTDGTGEKIGRITPSGGITEFPVPTSGGFPSGITAGPDGNLWFTETFGEKIGRITPAGVITEFPLPAEFGQPGWITTGPDGRLWFNRGAGLIGVPGLIGSITTAGVVETATLGPLGPDDVIVTGPDGNLWFTEYYAGRIGRATLSPTGFLPPDEFPIPSDSRNPNAITVGPDGNLWYTALNNKIGRITTAGAITEFSTPTANSDPIGITVGPDGNVWFTEVNPNKLGMITASGTITEFPLPAGTTFVGSIAAAPDGNIWFADDGGGRIGRLTLATDTTSPTIAVPSAITVKATSPQGAPVAYTVTATDADDAVASTTCVPTSGSTFAIGTTTVNCTASDTHGNTSTASFTVHVKGADEQLTDMLAAATGVGPGTSLAAKVNLAQNYGAAGDLANACSTLTAFDNQVRAQTGKTIPPPLATALRVSAAQITAVIGC